MKAIIDGFKYDTETAAMVFSYMLNEYEKGEMYRNYKYKFFCLHMLQREKEKLEYDYKIIPISKAQAMEMLVENDKIDEYEKLFGEIPEAEGEDYIPPEEDDVVENNDYTEAEIPEPEETAEVLEEEGHERKPQKIRRVQNKLMKACRSGDVETVKACLVCSGQVEQKHIREAIFGGNTDILRLLLDGADNLNIDKKEIRLAVLKGEPEVFKLVFSKRPDLKNYALIIGRKYLIVPIVRLLEEE